ncbi:MAG: beta-lactamase family protein [Deltaproteobacteria bacterium]|nr:beta-lactamase family protein [Deltaproteobacteria bacterium]
MRTTDPVDLGLDPDRLARLVAAIEADVGAERYDGAVVLVARGGQVALHAAIGWADRAARRRAALDDVFTIFSVTKTLTTVALLMRIDRGEIALTTPVAEVLPEFGTCGKQRITVSQLLTHTAGLATGLPPLPMESLGDLSAFVAAACRQPLEATPGSSVHYSAITAHAVLAEIVRRLDGGTRRFRDVLDADVLRPLGMRDTALGLRPDLAARKVPVVVRDRSPGVFDPDLLEAFNVIVGPDTEIPAAGAVSTVADLFRLAECFRRGGEFEGTRLFAPALLRLATAIHTGDRPNGFYAFACEQRGWDPFPANIGLSFFVRGAGVFPTYLGLTSSPRTYAGLGAGSSMFWVDPERDLTFVLLSAGLLEETRNLERCQRLSDLVQAAAVD